MNLDENYWLARYHKWMFGYLPTDWCGYAWNCIFALVTIMFSPIGRILRDDMKGESLFFKTIAGVCMYVLTAIVWWSGNTIIENYLGDFHSSFPTFVRIIFSLFIGLLVYAIVLAAAGGTIMGGMYLSERSTFTSKLKKTVAAVRNKYCTKITWVKDTSE